MAGLVGRKVIVREGGVVIASGIQNKSLTINKENLENTSDDDLGWRSYLDSDVGLQSVDVGVDGVLKNNSLITWAMSSTSITKSVEIEITGFGTFDGDFVLNSNEIGGSHNENVTFSGTLSSSGEVTFTAAIGAAT